MPEYNISNPRNPFVSSKFNTWFERLVGGVYRPIMPLGNIVDSSLAITIEKLEIKSNQDGLDAKWKIIAIGRGATAKITINELVKENFELCLGSSARQTGQSVTYPIKEKKSFVAGSLTLANYPIQAVKSILPILGDDEWAEGVTGDYEVNETTGVITLPVGSAIGANEEVWIWYTVTQANVAKYAILSDLDIEGRLTFTKLGTDAGPKRVIWIPSVKIVADGDIAMNPKTEEAKVSLSCEFQEDATHGFGYAYQW